MGRHYPKNYVYAICICDKKCETQQDYIKHIMECKALTKLKEVQGGQSS